MRLICMDLFEKDQFVKNLCDMTEDSSADRTGHRIRKIREEKNISRTQLGALVGLSADRIQQYENGSRKPRIDLLKKIASALDVETLALMDPVVSTDVGVMFALFEMEDIYGCRPIEKDGYIYIMFDNHKAASINRSIRYWLKERSRIETELSVTSSDEERKKILNEYHSWEWTYPQALIDESNKAMKKARLKSKIQELQEEIKKMDDDE